MDNLPRCAKWLADLKESSPREAQRVMRALPITHHADLEERAQGRPNGLMPGVEGLGEFPWKLCVDPVCRRCLLLQQTGGFGGGGYHFRHIGPWTGDADLLRCAQ